jgi:hypothetical protein
MTMNRTQAIERVDEILGLFAEMYISGRCPRCEVLLYDPEDKQHPLGATASRRVVHERSCEVSACSDELTKLTKRFGIPLERVVLAMPGSDTWVMTVKRAERNAGRGTVVVPTDTGQEDSRNVT